MHGSRISKTTMLCRLCLSGLLSSSSLDNLQWSENCGRILKNFQKPSIFSKKISKYFLLYLFNIQLEIRGRAALLIKILFLLHFCWTSLFSLINFFPFASVVSMSDVTLKCYVNSKEFVCISEKRVLTANCILWKQKSRYEIRHDYVHITCAYFNLTIFTFQDLPFFPGVANRNELHKETNTWYQ